MVIIVEFELIWLPLGSPLENFHEAGSCLENTSESWGWKIPGWMLPNSTEVLTEKLRTWSVTSSDGHCFVILVGVWEKVTVLLLFLQTDDFSFTLII